MNKVQNSLMLHSWLIFIFIFSSLFESNLEIVLSLQQYCDLYCASFHLTLGMGLDLHHRRKISLMIYILSSFFYFVDLSGVSEVHAGL